MNKGLRAVRIDQNRRKSWRRRPRKWWVEDPRRTEARLLHRRVQLAICALTSAYRVGLELA